MIKKNNLIKTITAFTIVAILCATLMIWKTSSAQAYNAKANIPNIQGSTSQKDSVYSITKPVIRTCTYGHNNCDGNCQNQSMTCSYGHYNCDGNCQNQLRSCSYGHYNCDGNCRNNSKSKSQEHHSQARRHNTKHHN